MNPKILIVDDEIDILEAIKLLLESEGFEVSAIFDGKQTFKEIKKFKPDVILLDVLISGVDGRDVCTKLKNNKNTKHIPIIMMSAHPNAHRGAKKSGADEFIAKPFETDFLINIVSQYTKN